MTTKLQDCIKKDKGIDDTPFNKSNVSFKLPHKMTIIIPSTQGQEHVSKKVLDSRARDVATYMTENFGGSTRISGKGQYTNKKYNTLDDENVVQVEVFMTDDDWNKHNKNMMKYMRQKKKSWNQQDLAVTYDSNEGMYFIK